jgi:predicted lipid-binding transport protein (Tim44 family)
MVASSLSKIGLGAGAVLAMLWSSPAWAGTAAYCDGYARAEAARYQNGGNIFGSTLGGAAFGAILGGIFGGGKGAGEGAAIGGGIGLLGGAANESAQWHAIYRQAFEDCMAQNSRSAAYEAEAPEPGSPEWYDYCAAKYRTFNPATGRYRTYAGQYRMCE